MNIIDNYFDKSIIDELNYHILHPEFPWYYQDSVAFGSESSEKESTDYDNFYHTHKVFEFFKPNSTIFDRFLPILEKLDVRALIRIKINKYPKTHSVYKHASHRDYTFKHKGCLLYLNTCDGYTEIENKKVLSTENRVVFFDPSQIHTSTTCTNSRFRFTVNFNYF